MLRFSSSSSYGLTGTTNFSFDSSAALSGAADFSTANKYNHYYQQKATDGSVSQADTLVSIGFAGNIKMSQRPLNPYDISNLDNVIDVEDTTSSGTPIKTSGKK